MKKLLFLGLFVLSVSAYAYSSCGYKPMKPRIPMGCKDLVAKCSCDSNGKNCTWKWICEN